MIYLKCEQGEIKSLLIPGHRVYKVVEPLGRVSRARGTVRATGEKGERCRDTEGEPPSEVKSAL